MFEPRVGVPDYPSLEKQVLEFWETREIFRQYREQTEHGPAWKGWTGRYRPTTAWAWFIIKRRLDKDIFDRFYAP